ncbi:amidohydrolase family protein [Nocardia terpenica]
MAMRIVALEEHFTTPAMHAAAADSPLIAMYSMLAEAGMWPSGGDVPPGITDIDAGRIAVMDAAGIDLQVLSQTAPGPESVPPSQAVRLAAEANDAMKHAMDSYPGRFSAFACLPVSDPAAAAAELDRAVTQLGFVGAMINGHVRGEYLDAPSTGPSSKKPPNWASRSTCTRPGPRRPWWTPSFPDSSRWSPRCSPRLGTAGTSTPGSTRCG